MANSTEHLSELVGQEYKYGFVTEIESDSIPPGLNEGIIRKISGIKKEPEWLLEWRLKAYRHWLTMVEPKWPKVGYAEIDFDAIVYYSSPKPRAELDSLDEVDPELLDTFK